MSSADLFYVKLADGDVHRVSLDQLDDAFQAGHIDSTTMVLADGSDTWTTLGDLAGMDEEDEVAPVQVIPQNGPRLHSAAPAPYAHSQSYVTPQAAMPAPAAGATSWQAPQAQWQAPQPHAQTVRMAQSAPAPFGLQASHAAPYGAQTAPLPYGYQAPLAPASYGQTAAMPAPRSQFQPIVANSVRPVSVDLGEFDPDMKLARRGGGKRWALALALLSVVGAAGGIAVVRPSWAQPLLARAGLRSSSMSVAVAAAAPPPAPVEAPPPPPQQPTPPPAPPPQPVAAAPMGAGAAANSPLSPHFTDRNSPDPKPSAAEADTKKPKGRAKGSPPAARSASKAKSTVFTTGGSKYDPLNSSI